MRIGQAFLRRTGLALIGTGAGLVFWLFLRNLRLAESHPQGYLFAATLAAVFFATTLLCTGPLALRRVLPAALALALALAGLLSWASLRFDSLPEFLQAPERLVGILLLGYLPLPFLIAAGGPGWRDYPALFGQAWSLLVRSVGAWVFVGMLWLLIFLSNTLLQLVHVHTIARLLEIGGLPWALTGAAFGLALAVVNEFLDFTSPYLTLRLLRLLVPVVLAVSAIFLVALPLHGLSTFFGGISSAQTLLAMALAGITLVSSALAETDADAVQAPVMVRSTQALALLLPILAGLGATAVWLRVAQYGWTPPRIASAMVAGLALAYGLAYALAVLRGSGWGARIRATNTVLALCVIGAVALAFTPALNPQRLAAEDQLARYLSGRLNLNDLDLLALRDDWGRPGREVLARLKTLAEQPGQEALRARLAEQSQLAAIDRDTRLKLGAQLRAIVPVRPEPAGGGHSALLDALIARTDTAELRDLLDACHRSLPDGAPGCVFLAEVFLPDAIGPQGLLLYRAPSGALRSEAVIRDPIRGLIRADTTDLAPSGSQPIDAAALIAQAQPGPVSMAPARMNAMEFDGHQIVILPAGQ